MRVQASRKNQASVLPNFSAFFGTRAFIGFIVTMVLTIVYYVQFRNYHASLEKLDKLTTLFHNPNARVASGEQGKRILKKLGVTTEKEVKEDKKTKLEDTLQQVSELLKASQEPKKVESVNDYKPPEIVEETNTVSSYQLIDAPQVHQPLLRAPSH